MSSIMHHQSSTITVFAKPQSKSLNETIPKRRRPERTPDQIARKRDQDREAQRLSRERTRRRIEEAETQLIDSQAVASKFEEQWKYAVEERDVARRISNNLRSELDSVCAQLDATKAHLATVAHILHVNGISGPSPVGTFLGPHCLSSPGDHASQLQSPQPSEGLQSGAPNRTERLSVRNMTEPSASPHLPTAMDIHSASLSTQPSSSSSQSSPHSSPSCVTEASSTYGSENESFPNRCHSNLPITLPPTCPMDSILSIFTSSRHELLRHGEPEDVVLGPVNPSLCVLSSLGIPSQLGMSQPVSQMIAEVMSKAQVLQGLPEQIAVLWLIHASLRVRRTITPYQIGAR